MGREPSVSRARCSLHMLLRRAGTIANAEPNLDPGTAPHRAALRSVGGACYLRQAAYGAVTHVVRSSYIGEHFSCFSTSNCLSTLMAGQFWLSTQDYPPRLCTLATFAGSRPDKFAFELGKSAQYCKHQATMRRVVVSAQVSLSDLNPAPFSAIVPRRFRRSRVDRASRSSRVTINTSPFARTAISA